MKERYIAFDVETPNSANDKMSAIGIAVIENGNLVQSMGTLVNPETHFDAFNTELTGITQTSVIDKPTFAQLWNVIEPVMDNGILVAHNAQFDMSVLSKCLNFYGIQWHGLKKYTCTCNIGKKVLPHLKNHRLDTMCDYYNIALDHHKADSDSLACAKILLKYLNCGVDISEFIRDYDLVNHRTLKKKRVKV